MYKVIRVISREGLENPKIFKGYKTLIPALKLAYKRNRMITTKLFGYKYFVFDCKNKKLLEAVAA